MLAAIGWLLGLLWAVAKPLMFCSGVLLGVANFIPYCWFESICSLIYRTQNLKKKYGASWALVTGSSSGIGKSIASKLASQGLNVVLVAYPDDLLNETHAELQAAHPNVTIRKVPVDLGRSGYMKTVADAIQDIQVQCIFLNAGYIQTGFFASTPLDKLMTNFECNTTSTIQLTHLLTTKLIDAGLPGCLVYTSSPAALLPTPFSVLYSATKTAVSSFGASLAAEVKPFGIDVLCFHPSPVASRFLEKAHKLDALQFFDQFSVQPEALPDTVFASIGRSVWRDVGPVAIGFRMLSKLIDYNTLAVLTATFAHTMPDFKKHMPKRGQGKKRE